MLSVDLFVGNVPMAPIVVAETAKSPPVPCIPSVLESVRTLAGSNIEQEKVTFLALYWQGAAAGALYSSLVRTH